MGHETILVIGDNFRDQLEKYQSAEYAPPMSRHFFVVNILEDAEKYYATDTTCFLQHVDGSLHDPWDAQFWRPVNGGKQQYVPTGFSKISIPVKERMSFVDWVKKTYGYRILLEGQDPDIFGEHQGGWVRVNANGQICEMIERTIPGGFLDWFESTDDIFKLKLGAYGIVIDGENEASATNGFAGSAKKSEIDFDAMREVIRTCAAERWDRAAAAAGSQSWDSFQVIWKRYENQKYSHELHYTAAREWAEQPAVKAIIDGCRILPSSVIRLSLPPTTGIIDASRIDNSHWEQLTVLERRASNLVWNDHSETGIDPLALPRDQYVQRFGLRRLLGYGKVIKDGTLLGEIDEIQLFDSISEETVLTLGYVHS